jgi:2-hydroxychromene-2-carboxylate isomerase
MSDDRTLTFWYDFASTYSYLSAMRVEAMAAERGVRVQWRPFLLGPIFAGQGWTTSPFNIYAAKGRYMVRDMARLAAARGLAFAMPTPFPQNSLLAARVGSVGVAEGWIAAFTRSLYDAEFARGRDISSPDVIGGLLADIGEDASRVLAAAQTQGNKDALRATTEEALRRDIFGAPSFTVGDELFWGDDRLEQALAAAAS